MDETFRQIVALSLVKNIGPVTFQRWLTEHGSVPEAFKAKCPDPKTFLKSADEEIKKSKEAGIDIVTFFDSRYPEALKTIYDPPILLYVKGALPEPGSLHVAVVGSRIASLYGMRMAREISRDLAKAGVVVVSGLALGIDSAGHEGALEADGRTLAVLGGGIRRLYPAENAKLADRIVKKGALISEYPIDMSPQAGFFPVRNRIISGLCSGVLVVEAKAKSGALITADAALEQGRDVFAVPGNADAARSQGTNGLLKQGAKLVTSAEDILNELKTASSARHAASALDLPPEEGKIYSLLESEALPVDDIIEQTGFSTQQTLSALTMLEMKGIVKQQPGKIFAKC